MEFRPKTTPDATDPIRRIFEHASRKGNVALVESIATDMLIASCTAYLEAGGDTLTVDTIESLLWDARDQRVVGAMDRWTDVLRYDTGAEFALERVLIPFAMARQYSHETRRQLMDGILGKSLNLIEPLLEYADLLDKDYASLSSHDKGQLSAIRGWMQEATVMALINHPQSADLAALPSSTLEDLQQHTDLKIYFRKHSEGFVIPVSVKTSQADTELERKNHPEVCVIGATEFGNLRLHITRLLVAEHHGHPGLTVEEEQEIQHARNQVMAKLSLWIKDDLPASSPTDTEPISLHVYEIA